MSNMSSSFSPGVVGFAHGWTRSLLAWDQALFTWSSRHAGQGQSRYSQTEHTHVHRMVTMVVCHLTASSNEPMTLVINYQSHNWLRIHSDLIQTLLGKRHFPSSCAIVVDVSGPWGTSRRLARWFGPMWSLSSRRTDSPHIHNSLSECQRYFKTTIITKWFVLRSSAPIICHTSHCHCRYDHWSSLKCQSFSGQCCEHDKGSGCHRLPQVERWNFWRDETWTNVIWNHQNNNMLDLKLTEERFDRHGGNFLRSLDQSLSPNFPAPKKTTKDTKVCGEAGTQPTLRMPPLREGRHAKLFQSALGLRFDQEAGSMKQGDIMIILDGGRDGRLDDRLRFFSENFRFPWNTTLNNNLVWYHIFWWLTALKDSLHRWTCWVLPTFFGVHCP